MIFGKDQAEGSRNFGKYSVEGKTSFARIGQRGSRIFVKHWAVGEQDLWQG